MGCNCNQSTNYNICNPAPCQEPQDCSCPTILSTDCVTYSGNDLECSGIVAGQTLTETIEQLDAFICEKVEDVTNALVLKNIGTGAKVYKGDDLLGRKELRTITKTGDLITVTENTDNIAVSLDEAELTSFVNELIPTPCVTSLDGSVTVVDSEGCFDLSVPRVVIEAGENTTVGGTGTELDPYVIDSIDTIAVLESGETTTVTGTGLPSDEYVVEVNNLQKTVNLVSFPYTLTSADDKYTIFINNGAVNVDINVPDSLVANFSCVFIQEGTGVVTVQASGTATLLYPSTALQNKIRGENYWAMVEKKTTTDNYFLLGSLLPV